MAIWYSISLCWKSLCIYSGLYFRFDKSSSSFENQQVSKVKIILFFFRKSINQFHSTSSLSYSLVQKMFKNNQVCWLRKPYLYRPRREQWKFSAGSQILLDIAQMVGLDTDCSLQWVAKPYHILCLGFYLKWLRVTIHRYAIQF